nr:MAG TPA: Major head protein [Caudoviricetes sp.]
MYKRFRCKIPMNLQTFAEGGEGGNGNAGTGGSGEPGTGNGQAGQQSFQFDYDRLANIIAGKQSATEDSVLKEYFKQQGLTKEQAEQAIADYKQQQAANQPDIAGMQTQLAQAQQAAQKAQLDNAAMMQAVKLGITPEKIPFVLKLADMSAVMDKEGKISEENLKTALDNVLKALPELKPQTQQQTGFQIGAPGSNQQQANQNDQLAAIFGNKK